MRLKKLQPWVVDIGFCLLVWVLCLWLLQSMASGSDLFTWSPSAAHHQAVVQVRTSDGSSRSCGSGTYVRIGQWAGVLTAKHCVDGGRTEIVWPDGSTTPGEVLTDQTGADCAFVQSTHAQIQPLAIAAAGPTSGEWVEFCGYGGPEDKLRHWWGRLNRAGENASYAGCVLQGDSGGPVLNRSGQVVGVIAWGGGSPIRYAGQAAAFGETGGPGYDVVRAFAERVENKYRGLFIGGMSGGCGPQGCPPPGGCGPGNGGGSWAYPPAPSPQPVPPPLPQPLPQPAPQPPLVPIAPTPEISMQIDYNQLARVLLEYCAADPRFRGPVGPQGDQGNPGPPAIMSAEEAEAMAAKLYQAMLLDARFRGPAGEISEAQIEGLYQRLKTDPALRPQPGPPGPAGPPGRDGIAGTSPALDIDQLAAAVAPKLPPIYFRKVHAGTGAEISPPEPVRLGEGFTFLLTPGVTAGK